MQNIEDANFANEEDKQRIQKAVKDQYGAKKCDTRNYKSTAFYTADDKRIRDPWNLNSGSIAIVTAQPTGSFFKGKLMMSFQLASPKIIILSNGVRRSGNKHDTTITNKTALDELMELQKHAVQIERGMDEEDIALAELAERTNAAAAGISGKRVASFDVSDAKIARLG
jgi:hypothetical protein